MPNSAKLCKHSHAAMKFAYCIGKSCALGYLRIPHNMYFEMDIFRHQLGPRPASRDAVLAKQKRRANHSSLIENCPTHAFMFVFCNTL